MTETIGAMKYEKIVRSPSKIVKGETVFDPEKSYMSCPRCGHHQKIMEHGEKRKCPQCALKIEKWGATLEISE